MTPFFCARSDRGRCGGVAWGGRRCEKTCGAVDGGGVWGVGLWKTVFEKACRWVGFLQGGIYVGNAFVETVVAEGDKERSCFRENCLWGVWKLLSGWCPVGWGTIKAASAGWIWECVAAWKLFSEWRPVGVGAIKAAPAGWVWECVAAWKLFLEWRPVGGGTIKAASAGGLGSVWARGNVRERSARKGFDGRKREADDKQEVKAAEGGAFSCCGGG